MKNKRQSSIRFFAGLLTRKCTPLIASITIAFTLLVTGTAVTKTISPKSNNTLVASAEDLCQNVGNKKYKVIAKSGFNIRKTSSANSAKIGSLAYGTAFTVIDEKTVYSYIKNFGTFSVYSGPVIIGPFKLRNEL